MSSCQMYCLDGFCHLWSIMAVLGLTELAGSLISIFNFINLFPKSYINLILGNRLVVKTTNLESRTCMNTGLKRLHLLIYKGKVFIGSFGCRNDCQTVHFNCRKRRDSGVPRRSTILLLQGILSLHVRFNYIVNLSRRLARLSFFY